MKAFVFAFLAVAVSATSYNLAWTIPSVPADYYDRTFVTGDIVNFQWGTTGSGHDIYLLASKAHYDACNFTGATMLSDNTGSYALTTTAGTHYIACSVNAGGHCSSGQKITFVVADTSSCDSYCTTMGFACTGANVQYAGAQNGYDQCHDFCMYGLFPSRSTSVTTYTADTFDCYNYHGTVAAGSASLATTHCPHAGPTGGGVCSSTNSVCRPFCRSAITTCGSTYASQSACETSCLAKTALNPFAPGTASGDTSDCRFYHLVVASGIKLNNQTAGLSLHCGHASDNGNGVCGGSADSGASTAQAGLTLVTILALAVSRLL